MIKLQLEKAYKILLGKKELSFVVDTHGDVLTWEEYKHSLGGLCNSFAMNIIPGSFNPLHSGHRDMKNALVSPPEMTFFEMSIGRYDKPPVSIVELTNRLEQFRNYSPVIITNAPRFIEKIGLLIEQNNELVFQIGIDTLVRMRDDYGVMGIQGLNAEFIINSRVINGKLCSLGTEFSSHTPCNCKPSPVVRSLESLSISSTQIRNSYN